MNLIDRVKNIITRPNLEWDIISNEIPDTNKIITSYVVPLVGAAALAAFIGYSFIGYNAFGFRVRGINWGIYQTLAVFLVGLLSVFVTAYVVDMLAPSFASEKNFPRSLQLVAYSFTPAWVGRLLAILPPIAFIGALFSIYCFYLMYIGMPKLKRIPPDRLIGYFVVSVIITIVVYFILNWIVTTLLYSILNLSYRTPFDYRP
ncbi:MAG: YIP1 family protein [Bacteroidota bacterium]|nr:YIP1 family protein [Flavisolibacter sp.]MDQ3843788.1 YIP1 family protein [Bacteroidota bacterium]